MAASLYAPDPRYSPCSSVINEELCMWGGRKNVATTSLQVYHPYLESWRQHGTQGPPPPGLTLSASAHSENHLYVYGGYKLANSSLSGCLNRLDTKTSSWTLLATHSAANAPMKKVGSGMIVYKNLVIIIGGAGIRNGPMQPGSEWEKWNDDKVLNAMGMSNEMHKYDLREGEGVHYTSWCSTSCASEASLTLGCSIEISRDIRECSSTLDVGLARAVSSTNTNFRLTFLLTRLQEALYEDLAV